MCDKKEFHKGFGEILGTAERVEGQELWFVEAM